MIGGISRSIITRVAQLKPKNLNVYTSSFLLTLQNAENNVDVNRTLSTSCNKHGRFGHRLVKLWEQEEYTTKPLKVYRTGGRLAAQMERSTTMVPGRVWSKRIGGGLRRVWHWVDRSRMSAEEVSAKCHYQERVLQVRHDDNRAGQIALVVGPLKERWIMATESMKPGNLITNSAKMHPNVEFKDGDAYPVGIIPTGTKICDLEFVPGKGSQIARSAGNFCTIVRKEGIRTIVKMPSGREINVDERCVAVVGKISVGSHKLQRWRVGVMRDQGIRPKSGNISVAIATGRRLHDDYLLYDVSLKPIVREAALLEACLPSG